MTSNGTTNSGPPSQDATSPEREPQAKRLQRNWSEILQELRVTQTGTQILTGFLLTLAFQPRFDDLDEFQRDVYLVLVVLAALTTALALAPVSLHRSLFREGAKNEIVRLGDIILKATLVGVALVLAGTVLLIFDVVVGRAAAIVTGGGALVVVAAFWLVLPMLAHPKRRRR
ncbi:MAG: sodium:proton antiporter [Microbacteriaceae bacterium]|nr:sodium:proton antiporter [Microbacteriaceae bacterium]